MTEADIKACHKFGNDRADHYADKGASIHLIGQEEVNIINWIESFTFTHPREFYDDLFQRQADQQSKTLTNVVINQMKAHKNMMKHSGVTLSTCPDLPICVGDQVRLKMEAYLR